MPSFSNRWGLPSCRTEDNIVHRCRGRRRGHVATCRARLKGWIKHVAARSPIWGDVDLSAFCRKTGYSREHATRELSKLRREGELAFETKMRTKGGRGSKKWGVIVADPSKLCFDKRSLFYDRRGKPLHNYTTLGNGGVKIAPTILILPQKRPRGRPKKVRAQEPVAPRKQQLAQNDLKVSPRPKTPPKMPAENSRVCDNANSRKDSYGIQQPDQYGAGRDVAQWRGWEEDAARRKSAFALRKKAFAMLEPLVGCHWDNCKVIFARRTAFRFSLASLADGHRAERIRSCYADALQVCHAFAVDRAASTGKITFFNLSSTVVKARKLLARDGLTRRERVGQWYRQHRLSESHATEFNIDPDELARVHAQVIATFPR